MAEAKAYQPYAPNAEGFTEVLIDLKETISTTPAPSVVGIQRETFEAVTQGDALYLRASDGKVGRAIANDTFDKANVLGFARTSKASGAVVDVMIIGILAISGLDAGDIFYLSDSSAGAITSTAPSAQGTYVTRVGEAASTSELSIQIEPPIRIGGPKAIGQTEFTTAGLWSWTVPSGVTSVSVVCVGGGGGGGDWDSGLQGGAGGGLGYINDHEVTPGDVIEIRVGSGGAGGGKGTNGQDGGTSYFVNSSTCRGGGGEGGQQSSTRNTGGDFAGDGGGTGGGGTISFSGGGSGGGGGAGGYSGDGGHGSNNAGNGGSAGAGGAGGGGGGASTSADNGAGGGGGVGIYGEGASGARGASGTNVGEGGGGGSGGTAGATGQSDTTDGTNQGGQGGLFGGGGGCSNSSGDGGGGAVRIIWPGDVREFPSTRTADE